MPGITGCGVQCMDVEDSVAEAEAAAGRAEVARDAAQLSAGVFADTAAGLAVTTSGKYFSVPSADSAEHLILYFNNSGTAVEKKRYPSSDAVKKPVWTGKKNGWPDPFFRHSHVGVDFLGKQRWRSSINNGFAPASFVPSTVFDGNALRRTGGGTAVQCGPLLWLDEIGAAPGDTVTIYALLTGSVGDDAYIYARFYTAASAKDGGGLGEYDAYFVRDSGNTGVMLSDTPQRLRLSKTVPPGAAAVALFPYSSTMSAGESFDIHALWAFKGAIGSGPDWPVLVNGDYATARAELAAAAVDALQQDVMGLQSDVTELQSGIADLVSVVYDGQQLEQLKRHLTDPLTQFLGVVLVGDSITWGMTVTGQASVEPRTGALTDTRNNESSQSWANLLHKYIGAEYYEDSTVTASAWSGSSGGVAQFEYSKTVDLYPGYAPFTAINNYNGATPGVWSSAYNAGTTLGYYLQAQVNSSADDLRLRFTMTGTEFDLVFAALADGAKYELFINDVSHGVFSTQTGDTGLSVSFKNVRTHSFPFVRDGVVELRVIPADVERDVLRVEAIRVNRRVRVTNNGIIGTNAIRYATMFVNDAVRVDDTFAFIQLGTNDRAALASSGVPESPTTLYKYLGLVIDAVVGKGVMPILMCANAVTNNSKPTYKYDMADVRAQIMRLSADRGIAVIDHFAETRSLIAASDTSWLADGLHPNDSGHLIMFENIKRRIDNA